MGTHMLRIVSILRESWPSTVVQGGQVGIFEATYDKFGLFFNCWPNLGEFIKSLAYLFVSLCLFNFFSSSLFNTIQNLAFFRQSLAFFFSCKLLATLQLCSSWATALMGAAPLYVCLYMCPQNTVLTVGQARYQIADSYCVPKHVDVCQGVGVCVCVCVSVCVCVWKLSSNSAAAYL